jgi:hypothetical protein
MTNPTRRELPLNPYAAEPLEVWEARLLAPGDSEPRFLAWQAITQLATAETTATHALRLLDDDDAELRAAAARWFSSAIRAGRLDGELAAQRAAIQSGLQSRLEDADPDVQLEAARGLVRLLPELPLLADVVCGLLAREETQATTQAALAEICGWLPTFAARTLPTLARWLAAESAELREATATALARLGALCVPLEAALAAALDDEEPVVREQAALALGALPALTADSRAALQLATQDEDAGVAAAAERAL